MIACKRTVASLTLLLVAVTSTTALAAQPAMEPARNHPTGGDGLTWIEVIECYRKPQAAIGCLESRMGRALVTLRDTAVRMARSDPDTAAEDVTHVGDLVQQIGEFITYGISSFFRGDDDEESDLSADSGIVDGSSSNSASGLEEGTGRGHHKKKKIQKEIKKFVLKVLFGIYLFKQKIKMILMSIQSILMSKFLVVAMIYALSNTFKIWWEIKHHKHHKHDKVVYYENAHHQHHYEAPEHSEYEEHPHSYGSIWGRSIAVTEPGSVLEQSGGPIGSNSINRYVRRVSRTVAQEPMAAAQAMAFNAQKPVATQ